MGATGAMIDLVGDVGDGRRLDEPRRRSTARPPTSGCSRPCRPDPGRRRVRVGRCRPARSSGPGDYLEDERFTHTDERDAFVRASGIESVIAAPLVHRDVVVGAITVYGDRADAFDAEDAALLAALADQAAVAIANARLIEELERSRAEIARRADSERTLREIAARVSAILEPGRGPPADRRRDDPAARVRRRPDRPVRPGDRRPALVVRGRRRDVEDPGLGA